ncbi:hypothetical protein EJ419_05685 [Alloscardovia theropitheci]|uniref:SGNH hydrolase-type esterase domain-containing protein n=1 Tax=Alloscardovia theropitheci TaxID=2496842 RepID=A0A4R0QRD9_9BIFI|nr:SGNH/GDSL hydrolase family protein [Alloscardovia theropitheci]TCD53928.1 hypothetical protein EJ419_05685 [Alloscardovia theropitheci]
MSDSFHSSRSTYHPSSSYGIFTKFLANIEAFWAKSHIELAQEPRGDRSGTITYTSPEHNEQEISPLFPALHIAMIGDSLTVACGTTDQKDGFAPRIAQELSSFYERDVTWATYGKLGATMRRVRYRLLPELLAAQEQSNSKLDVLYICAASNDVMAQRDPQEYVNDLRVVLDNAREIAHQIIVLGPAQFYTIPALGKHLHTVLYHHELKFIKATQELCASKNVQYIDMTQADISTVLDRFYASDNFHPNKFGYRIMGQYAAAHTQVAH